jgi:uncharacterized membrane protein YphA (DoxX/SURF4 family)
MIPNAACILILILFAITFLQSGYDKLKDWKGNVEWLTGHFSGTFLEKFINYSLILVVVLEITTGVLCICGIIELINYPTSKFAFVGAFMSCTTLLLLLFGQRIAKDYEGAKTIIIYFIPAVLLVYWL